jgi:predicted kinase
MAEGVWLVTGVQAAGKSTIADLLARQFERGVHVRGGQFYRWAVRGWVPAGDARADEARRLLDLRYRLAALAADEYCEAGFTTVVQDNIFGADVVRWLGCVAARPRHLVVLRPSIAVVRQREQQRHAATGKTAYRPGGFTADGLDQQLAVTPRIGLWLDTSAMSPAETVAEILRRTSEAVVGQAALAEPCCSLND